MVRNRWLCVWQPTLCNLANDRALRSTLVRTRSTNRVRPQTPLRTLTSKEHIFGGRVVNFR